MQSNLIKMEESSHIAPVVSNNFERIYFPSNGHDPENIKRIVCAAEQNGFVAEDTSQINVPRKVEEIISNKRYIILQRCYHDLTLSTRSPRNCPPVKLGPKEQIIYNPEEVVNWVEKQKNFIASN